MPQQPEREIVNRINVEKLRSTMDAIKGDPDLAKLRFRAHNEWINGTNSRTTIKDFYGAGKEDTSRNKPFVLESDEPAILLGEDHGPNATEAALYAWASCLNAIFMYHASARGIEIDGLEIDLESELDLQGLLEMSDKVRPRYVQGTSLAILTSMATQGMAVQGQKVIAIQLCILSEVDPLFQNPLAHQLPGRICR